MVKEYKTRQLYRFKNQNSTRKFGSEISRKLDNFISHLRMTKVTGIKNITEIRKENIMRNFHLKTYTDKNICYGNNRVHNASENVELK